MLETVPFLLTDFYKITHREQYPPGTEYVYSTWIPRGSMYDDIDEVVAFGFQAFIDEYLIEYFNKYFFERPLAVVLNEYADVIRFTLGTENPDTSHLEYLHNLGYLPIQIKAVPEGTRVPLRVPMLTIENTDPNCFWLTNALETLFSAQCWLPSTSATIARQYRKVFDDWAEITGADLMAVQFQGHDFSMRGMSNVDAAAASGAGHLLSFTGTDTIPAILWAQKYYFADPELELVGTSIPATEHSVMCTYGRNELASYKRILTEVYPNGLCAIVSDTWNLWDVMTKVLPTLKNEIMARDGKMVIRPDSGDPVDILCGTLPGFNEGTTPEEKGVVELLWDTFGGTVNAEGYKELDSHVGAIYGDAITMARQEQILRRLAVKGFASTNIVLGIGSFTYQYQTRDTFGFALKSTQAIINGEEIAIFKDPVTDKKKLKKSLTGRVVVNKDEDGDITVIDGLDRAAEAKVNDQGNNLLETVYLNGELLITHSFADVRARVSA